MLNLDNVEAIYYDEEKIYDKKINKSPVESLIKKLDIIFEKSGIEIIKTESLYERLDLIQSFNIGVIDESKNKIIIFENPDLGIEFSIIQVIKDSRNEIDNKKEKEVDIKMEENKETIGLIFGKFAPLHNGHINMINQAATLCDKLYVFLSYNEKFLDKVRNSNLNGDKIAKKLSLKNRLRWLKSTYKDLSDRIIIDYIDETNIPEYPNGWEAFSSLIKTKLYNKYNISEVNMCFSSEKEYSEGIEKYFGCKNHIIDFDREKVTISATNIRNQMYKYWEYLPSMVRKDFVFKVCLVGLESSGKTTTTKYLAKYFNTSWVEEYGRTFCEEDLGMDESLLESKDYITIAEEQKRLIKDGCKTANKILLIDTGAAVTQYFHRLYEGKINERLEQFIEDEDFDLILDLRPTLDNWVDDGLRINGPQKASLELIKSTGLYKIVGDKAVLITDKNPKYFDINSLTRRDVTRALFDNIMKKYYYPEFVNVDNNYNYHGAYVILNGTRNNILNNSIKVIEKSLEYINDGTKVSELNNSNIIIKKYNL